MTSGSDQVGRCDRACPLPDPMPGTATMGIAKWRMSRMLHGARLGTGGDLLPGIH